MVEDGVRWDGMNQLPRAFGGVQDTRSGGQFASILPVKILQSRFQIEKA